jgi:hypothetical protein
MVMSYNPTTAKLTGGVAMAGVFIPVGDMPVAVVGNRRQVFDIYNQRNTIAARLISSFYKKGLFSNGSSVEEGLIGRQYSYVYGMEEPIMDARKLQICPWDIRPTATVVSWNGRRLVLDIDEDYYGWAPDVCFVGDHIFRLVSLNQDIAEFDIDTAGTTLISGIVTIRPWFTEEFVFSDPGVVRSRIKLPSTSLFVLGSKAVEVELYETFGRLLDVGNQPDSQEYLNIIRGVQFGLFSHPTANNIANAVSAICGAPYTIKSGIIESISTIEGDLGQDIEIQINVSGNIVKCAPYWREFISPVGTSVAFMGSLVNGVDVVDWVTRGDVLDERLVDRWRKWSTFIVEVSDSLGVTGPGAVAIFNMLNRSRSRHTTFMFSSKSSRSEIVDDNSDLYGKWSTMDASPIVVQPHSIEDLTFDDYGEVINNAFDYQTLGSTRYSEEYQFGEESQLDEHEGLNMGQYLDSLRISDPMINPDGSIYYRSRSRKNTSSEGRDFLGLYQNFGPKPYSLLSVFNGSGSILSAMNSGRWYQRSASSVVDIWSESDSLSYACVTTNVLESYNRGYTWASNPVTSATGSATKIKNGYAVGIGATKYWKRSVIGVWQEFVRANIAGNPGAVDAIGSKAWVFWQGTDEVLMSKSLDDGVTWSVGVVVASAVGINIFDAHFIDDMLGLIATNNGLWSTADGGSSWTQRFVGLPFNSVTYSGALDIAYASVALTGNIRRLFGVAEGSIAEGGAIATGGSSLLKVCSGNNHVFAVESGNVYRSKDHGNNWSTAMTGIIGSPYTIAVSENGLMRLAAGGAIWSWF